ncbi:helix-turn-helix domain-containing protein [Methyloceanibacter sp.]|jgi:MerR family transcriptional regulator, mercuric resistance operon regulatory protein|uniref:MerR family transcriptional regulator n=1 Tax=Methyloceanibacter sp. TaxID=1965321 RepID=UPI002C97224D|nr:helix-turn-helix domain-containing protein [Methyloceanibacter sp.]HML93310.1 helix-turn-helix domain-containing protein [Methyloceanibacter sp.]
MLIGKIAAETGVHVETIRYYERIGLIDTPPRTQGGFRNYNQDHAQRLILIRRGRELGFSLDNIRTLIALSEERREDETKLLALRHLADVQDKIINLKRLEQVLKNMTGACKPGRQSSCPIFGALSGEN